MYFETGELTVKPLSDLDRDAMVELFTDEIVKQFYMVPDFADRAQAVALFERIRELSEQEERYVAGIYLEERCIGILNATDIREDTIELGYAILPAHHNRGYCTAVLTGAIAYLFDRGFRRVLAGAFEENLASLRVMEKSGMERISLTEEITYRGKTHHCVYYAATRP